MRVADRTTSRNFLKYLDTAKTNYAQTNERVASGNRFTRISDDVSAGTRALRIRGDLAKAEEHYNNVKAINEELVSTENAMTSISEIIGKIHSQKVVKALNDPTGDTGRDSLANEVKAMKEEILQFANSKYYNRYVLGGSNASTAPFTVDTDTGKLLYNKVDVDSIQKDDDGYFNMKDVVDPDTGTITSVRTAIPMDGDIYVDIGLGIKMNEHKMIDNTAFRVSYSGLEILSFGEKDGVSNNIYNIIDGIERAIRSGDMETLKTLDTRLVSQTQKFTANLTDIGANTNFLTTIQTRLEDEIDGYQNQVKNVMGIDDAEEATRQTMNDYVLKAVLSMGANIIPATLMDYLR